MRRLLLVAVAIDHVLAHALAGGRQAMTSATATAKTRAAGKR
jgi:hypothetical protein